jgi:hypothetical protein
MLLSRTLEEVHARIGANDTVISKCLLLLPTIHYWTSAIGKDSLLFLAITLCIWSTLNLSRRILYFGFALFLMLLTRVHIALVVVASLSIAATFYRGLSLGRRIMLLAPAAAAVVVLVLVVRTSFGVNLADAGSIANFLAERSAMWQLAAGNASIYGASYPVKLVSLLVRPMFVDARNAFGVVASVENLIVLTIILTCVVQWRKLLELYKKVFFIRFALIATIGLILLLAIANYNVGLGLRQRTMFFPSLLSVFAAVWAYSSRLRRERQRPVGEPLIHAPLPSHAMTALDAGPQLSKS